MTLLVLLDLSAAFDTVDPNILLTRSRSKLGLNGTAVLRVCSYLSGKTQRISVQGALSKLFHLRYGVPQRSFLGPFLFSIYASKIFDIVGRHLPKVHCYADDSSFIHRLTQAVLLVKMRQLDQWKPVSRTLSSG